MFIDDIFDARDAAKREYALAYNKWYYTNHAEQMRQATREWYRTHPQQVESYGKEYRETHKRQSTREG